MSPPLFQLSIIPLAKKEEKCKEEVVGNKEKKK